MKSFIIEELARRPPAKNLISFMSMAIEIDNLFFSVNRRHTHQNVNNNGNSSRSMSHHTSLTPRNHSSQFNASFNNRSTNNTNSRPFNTYKSNNRNQQFRPNHQFNNRMNNNQASSSSSAIPMELGSINAYKPLSAAVREFRRANELCMYCGEKNHRVANCPNKPINKRNTGSLGSMVNQAILHKRTYRDLERPRMPYHHHLSTLLTTTSSCHKWLFILPVTIFHGRDDTQSSHSEAMVDTGASSNFISQELVSSLRLYSYDVTPCEEIVFRLANNTTYVSKRMAIIPLKIDNTTHEELLNLRIIDTASFPIILGMPWLRRHNPELIYEPPLVVDYHALLVEWLLFLIHRGYRR